MQFERTERLIGKENLEKIKKIKLYKKWAIVEQNIFFENTNVSRKIMCAIVAFKTLKIPKYLCDNANISITKISINIFNKFKFALFSFLPSLFINL
mgnify:CR=1 FL=1